MITRLACMSALALSACSTSALTAGGPLAGEWGGVHAALSLTTSGGTITYDCARGVISEPVRSLSSGDFTAAGFHMRGHGGPVRIGEVVDSVPARYAGHVSGTQMRLQVFAGADTLGPFDLRLDAAPQLFRCL